MTTPHIANRLHELALLQAQIDTVERCYWLIADRVTVFDAGRQLQRLKIALETKLHQINAAIDDEAPTRNDRKVIAP